MSDAGKRDLWAEDMGLDAAKWAKEFRAIAIRLGYSDMDEGWLIGWFANAIEFARRDRVPQDGIEPTSGQIDILEREVGIQIRHLNVLADRIAKLQQFAVLSWRLRSYTAHDDDCARNRYPHYRGCSCGLQDLLDGMVEQIAPDLDAVNRGEG